MSERQEVRFEQGYDYREVDAGKPAGQRRGCHGLGIRWLLHGELGTVQFLLWTDWLPSDVHADEWGPSVKRAKSGISDLYPMAVDLGYHWRTPQYEGQESRGECEFLSGAPCFYDGSGLNAESVMAALFTGGGDAVWTALQSYYDDLARTDKESE